MRLAGGKAAEEAVESMRRVEGLAVVSAAWLLIAVFAGIPYMWNGLGLDRRDVRVDVGPDDHRRDDLPRLLALRAQRVLLARR